MLSLIGPVTKHHVITPLVHQQLNQLSNNHKNMTECFPIIITMSAELISLCFFKQILSLGFLF